MGGSHKTPSKCNLFRIPPQINEWKWHNDGCIHFVLEVHLQHLFGFILFVLFIAVDLASYSRSMYAAKKAAHTTL